MSSQNTEGDEEVSEFFRNVQEISEKELSSSEVMDKLKTLEDSVGLILQQLKKLEKSNEAPTGSISTAPLANISEAPTGSASKAPLAVVSAAPLANISGSKHQQDLHQKHHWQLCQHPLQLFQKHHWHQCQQHILQLQQHLGRVSFYIAPSTQAHYHRGPSSGGANMGEMIPSLDGGDRSHMGPPVGGVVLGGRMTKGQTL
ncbi:uncharacterized protein LOC105850189 [Hydra vulgaris]|uniref:uncharacterized protein LOC105850189 n=1 Tax=Hydra vulgaris TaxID=6087 RepID=UPI0032EA6E1C